MLYMIVNPVAGSGFAARFLETVRQVLERENIEAEILLTQRPGHATELAQEAAGKKNCSGIVSIGGDGTLLEVARGLAGTNVPLGIIPAGTGNDFIKSVGIPRRPEDALSQLKDAVPTPVDTAEINGQLFMNVSGTGFDVTVLDYTESAKKYCRGILPYLIGLIRAIFRYKPVRAKITVDGETIEQEITICSIANGRFIGGGIPICPAADPADGKLDVVLVDKLSRWRIVTLLPALLGGKVLRVPCTKHILAESVVLEADGMRLNVDGEIQSADRAEFRIKPHQLQLLRKP